MNVAILVHNYFEQSEFEDPINELTEAGFDITIVSSDKLELTAMQHVEQGSKFTADLLLEDAEPDQYDILVLPGGVINADSLRMQEKARTWVLDYLEQGKLVAAICHAPWLLVSADVLEGRRLTSYYTLQDDIRNAGGEWADSAVVIDDNLITSRSPDDLPAFNKAISNWMSKQPA
jgi:protease I